jgi:tetratricopeptide (TPR) repeat protein
MRKLFDRITERLRGFVSQRDHVGLVLRCRDADGIAILKILEGLDEASTSEMYWMYPGEFSEPHAYVGAIVKDFAAKHEGVRLALEHNKMKGWPPIPPPILDESQVPAQRLRELMIFSRSLLPQPEGLVVWVLFPLQTADPAGYAHLIRELLQHQYPFPWFHHMRAILREDPANPALPMALAGTARVDYYSPDLSDEAMENSLEEEAADEQLPLRDRIQAMFLSAQRDYAFGRFDEALKKHEVVLRYHAAIGNAPMVALALNSVGEIHQRAGRPEQASRCFETALEPACAGQPPSIPVLFNILLNLSNLRIAQSRFAEAEVYCDATGKLATVQRNPSVKVQSIENLGYCQYMQGKGNEAIQSWLLGAALAAKLELRDSQKSMLGRLRHYYAATNQASEQREIERQLFALDRAPLN